MNLGPDVDLEDCTLLNLPAIYTLEISDYVTFTDVSRPDPLSSAEIASIVQAAASEAT